MIEETIAKIEARLAGAQLTAEQRGELEQLLRELRAEARACEIAPSLEPGAGVDSDVDARSAVTRLESSLTGFEASHPQLVAIVNRISTTLANMGI